MLFAVLLFVARGDETLAADVKFLVAQPVRLHAAPPRDTAVILPDGNYRVTFENDRLTFFRADNMLEIGALAVQKKEAPKKAVPGAVLKINKDKATLTVVIGRVEIIVRGEPTHLEPLVAKEVNLSEAEAASVPTNLPGADDPVEQSWLRLKDQLVHCADHAQKSGWQASDEKYQRCVCPLAVEFRMPGISAVRQFSLERHADVALSIDAAGKITDCKVVMPKK